MTTLTIWMGGIMTLCIFSFLYKDNPFFRFAENLMIGVSAGYYFSTVYFHQVLKPNLFAKLWPTLFGSGSDVSDPMLYIPGILGLLMLFRLTPRFSWLSRFSVAFVTGASSGLAIVVLTKEMLLPQIRKAAVPLYVSGNWFLTFSNWVLLLGTVSCLFYFFFSAEHKGPVSGPLAKIGVLYLMIGFGALFGVTVMSRIALLIGRIQFLANDFGGAVRAQFPGFLGLLGCLTLIGFSLKRK